MRLHHMRGELSVRVRVTRGALSVRIRVTVTVRVRVVTCAASSYAGCAVG